jgi:hypothetical protein
MYGSLIYEDVLLDGKVSAGLKIKLNDRKGWNKTRSYR